MGQARRGGSVFVELHHNAKCVLQRHFFFQYPLLEIFSFPIDITSTYTQFNALNSTYSVKNFPFFAALYRRIEVLDKKKMQLMS